MHKQVKYFIRKFLISGNFFSGKEFSDLYTVVLASLFTVVVASFPPGECVDDLLNSFLNNTFNVLSISIQYTPLFKLPGFCLKC